MPDFLYVDNGRQYNTEDINPLCAQHGFQLVLTPPGASRGKGTVERCFNLLNRTVIARLPGYAGSRGASLTLHELREVIATFIREYADRQRDRDGQSFSPRKQNPYDRLHPLRDHDDNAKGPEH